MNVMNFDPYTSLSNSDVKGQHKEDLNSNERLSVCVQQAQRD